jgi:hypothetical protein
MHPTANFIRNTRLLNELIAHADFFKLFVAVEIYLDKTIDPQLKSWNATFEVAEQKIRKHYNPDDVDRTVEILNAGAIDEDEFLLNRVIERFRRLLDTLHSKHAKKVRSSETKQADILKILTDDIDKVMQSENKGKAKLAVLASISG